MTEPPLLAPESPAPAAPAAARPARLRRALAAVARHPERALLAVVLLAVIGFAVAAVAGHLVAFYHFRAGRSCVEKYRDAEALGHFRYCLQVWPRDPETLLLAARAARRRRAFADAEQYQERYLACVGEDDDLTLEGLLLRAELGELDEVRLALEKLVDQGHPATGLILEAQARGYLRQFRLVDAMERLRRWQQRDPDNAQIAYLRGQVFDRSVNLHEAIASYRRALKADPEHDDARRMLAGHLLDLAQGREALPHLTYLVRRYPDDLPLRVLLARCRSQLGQASRAEALLDEVLARDPENGPALAERGNLALQRGDNERAETCLRKAAARDPTNYQAHYQLYQALKRLGKADQARALDKRLDMMRADIQRIQDIVRGQMQARPHDPALHYELGMIYLRAGAAGEGLRWLHSALGQDPNYAPAHRALAAFYQQTGSPGRAAHHRQRAQAANNHG